ncbi:MAG: FGGY-family carbohydrate kinase [Actinomyces sp.]|uniref:rhamnulokinase n=1 Tax=Actinomyces sp. TaxID=29317 RepID=UPI0026DCE528|nr:rhamnulokinase family protein [Actinomyces sp.]MDO4243090.1 FGGY-family carbohydrate kinase [Actinomyces sp.]
MSTTGHDTPVHVAAIDLGASSGRVMVGSIAGGRITLTETRRFTNAVVPLPTEDGMRLYWDVLRLWEEIREGLLAAARDVGPLSAVGIDTWAVDYGLVDPQGALTGQVASYRCRRTRAVPAEVFAAIPAAEMYAVNGLQVQDFNTVFQLLAESRDGALAETAPADDTDGAQRTMLLLPDLLAYWLTGRKIAEITNASTTGLVDAHERTWSAPLLERLHADLNLDLRGLLPPIVEAGTVVGPVRRDVVDLLGPDGHPTPVVAVGSHDTASAVAAVPARAPDFAYISCGTWSLVGLELDAPVLTEASRAANFTNELGVDGTVRYLKNVMGLWVFNEAVRTWRRQGLDLSYRELDLAAEAAEPLRTVVDVNDPAFFAPGDMAARIDEVAARTGQPRPRNPGEYVRCIDDSLALAYRRAVRQAGELSGKQVGVLHMVGGGTSNRLLCRLAADATGLPVVAGPTEATALGNVVVAARGAGLITGDLADLRAVVRASTEMTEYTPDPATADSWNAAEDRLFG